MPYVGWRESSASFMGPLQSKTVPFGRLVHRDHSNAKGASGGIAVLRAYNCRLINNLSGPRMGLIIRTTAHAPVAARMEAAVLRDVSGPRLPCGLGNRQWSSDFSGVDGGRPAAAVSLRAPRGAKNSDLAFVLLHGAWKGLIIHTPG